MDLSGVIFVVLALAWAAYLLPKALKHHDELASTRPVDRFSPSVRVLSRHPRSSTDFSSADERDERGGVLVDQSAPEVEAAPPVVETSAPVAPPLVTRAAARRAAQRRRRVLTGLLVVLVAVVGCAFFAVVPWVSVAAPVLLIVGFLVVARLSVRRTERAHSRPAAAPVAEPVPARAAVVQERPTRSGLTHDQLAAEVAVPLEDEGSLWDPLPLTLPTYVGKAKALRTVRTIELTGMVSAGHDAADSALVREREQVAAQSADAHDEGEQHRAAGA